MQFTTGALLPPGKRNVFLNFIIKLFSRGALEAINVGDRQGYVKLMQSLIGKDFRLVSQIQFQLDFNCKYFRDMC